MAVSKLTCSEDADSHFKLSDTASLGHHDPVENVVRELKTLLSDRYVALSPKVEKYAMECQAQIVRRHMRFKGLELRNECGVRYTYGDPLVDMLVDGHGYSMQFEETIGDNPTSLSSRSRTDYSCWNVYTVTGGSEEQVCVTVFETKHQRTVSTSCYAQVLGYYCARRHSSNRSGVAILVNECDSTVSITIFLFPYFSTELNCYGVQSLMLPEIKYKNSPYLTLGGIALIYLICWDGEELLKLKCPEELTVHSNIKVYTNEDLKDQQLREKEQEIQQLRQEIQQLQQNMQIKDQEIKQLQQELQQKNEGRKRQCPDK